MKIKQTPPEDNEPYLITQMEAARRLGIEPVAKRPKRVIQKMVGRGELRSVRVGKWLMIDPVSVDRFIAGAA